MHYFLSAAVASITFDRISVPVRTIVPPNLSLDVRTFAMSDCKAFLVLQVVSTDFSTLEKNLGWG